MIKTKCICGKYIVDNNIRGKNEYICQSCKNSFLIINQKIEAYIIKINELIIYGREDDDYSFISDTSESYRFYPALIINDQITIPNFFIKYLNLQAFI